MNHPAEVGVRFLQCVCAGFLLGFGIDAFFPLKRGLSLLFQLLVSVQIVLIWCVCCFGICRGDIRAGYLGGCALGLVCWKKTLSPSVRGIFGKIWSIIFRFTGWSAHVFYQFFKKVLKIEKFFFATGKKSVTIEKNNRRKNRHLPGGTDHVNETGFPGPI